MSTRTPDTIRELSRQIADTIAAMRDTTNLADIAMTTGESMPDTLKITILADGTIRTETDQISQANHESAEEFLRQMIPNRGLTAWL